MRKLLSKLMFLTPVVAFAGNSRPTNGISQISSFIWSCVDTVTGPWGIGVSIVAIVGAGAAWAMSDHGTGARKASAVGLGVVVIVNASSWIATLFGANI
jgi:type IV secretory pathway VirB2 component (pilin)